MITPNFKTTDIVLAAVLKMEGYKLERIDVSGRQGTFHFIDVKQVDIDDFRYDRIRVEPKDFNQSIRQLTTTIKGMTVE